MIMLHFIMAITISYLMGSICSAVLVSRIFQLPDPREAGSKNPGATNVLRLSGKKYAFIVLLADGLKGYIPLVIAHSAHMSLTIQGYMCLAAVLGHVYPVFFQFKGGKGVATALGALLGLNVLVGLAAILTWTFIAYIWRYSSLASMITFLLAPFCYVSIAHDTSAFIPLIVLGLLILYKHHANMTRLFDGKEPKIFAKKS